MALHRHCTSHIAPVFVNQIVACIRTQVGHSLTHTLYLSRPESDFLEHLRRGGLNFAPRLMTLPGVVREREEKTGIFSVFKR